MVALLAIVLVIATVGLVYELVMAAVASYVLGDSVTQFSIVIGVYLSALGLGAHLSRYVERDVALVFVDVELSAALIGGSSAPGLFLAFSFTGAFRLVLYATVLAVGVLVGLELPLLLRILRRDLEFKELVARALTFDYAGALLGSLGFSLLFMPLLGLVHTSLVCGLVNAVVGLASTFLLAGDDPNERRAMGRARIRSLIVMVLIVIGLVLGSRITETSEAALFGGRILLAEQSRYQRIVLSERGRAVELYLNGHLQFSSLDEHRYHEALVHPAMSVAAERRRVLVGGGGDGLAVREILRWPEVESVTLVDLDAKMTALARTNQSLVGFNHGALDDGRVRVVNEDAMVFFTETHERFDVVVLDFPDPSNYSVGKLYSDRFYRLAKRLLEPKGALVVQATSPLFAPSAFFCIDRTLAEVGFSTRPYHVFVPSFGEWGFVLATLEPAAPPRTLPPAPLRYLDSKTVASLFAFAPDMPRVETRINRLDNQALVAYYVEEWNRF